MRASKARRSLAFGKRCREAGVVQSMGSVGDAYRMCESFFATLANSSFSDTRGRAA